MKLYRLGMILAAIAVSPAAAAESSLQPSPTLSYADVADLALAAPVAAQVRVKEAMRLDPKGANVPVGVTRYYVRADVVSLIRSPVPLPSQLSYLADVPVGPDGKAGRIRKKDEFLIFGSAVPNRPGELQLAAPDAQIPWSVSVGDRARAILKEASAADAAPRIVGIGRAFHVAGTLPGEGETQIFLLAAGGRPISLNILRRPGQQPTWAVALGEIVDEAAAAPRPDTLLWYRLACGLPHVLPPQSLAEASPEEATAIRADYQLVLDGLGQCVRQRSSR
jgi:hypothetical protein